jgi:hypothetical protein
MARPFVHLVGGNSQPSVFDGDSHALPCFKAGILEPSSGEIELLMRLKVRGVRTCSTRA